jgi:hypothetical protein
MRLESKATLFLTAFILVPVATIVPAATFGALSHGAIAGILFVWIHLFVLGPFVIIRCPHCRQCAFLTPRGASAPWVGTNCRHCGKSY